LRVGEQLVDIDVEMEDAEAAAALVDTTEDAADKEGIGGGGGGLTETAAQALWRELEAETVMHATALCEQLRLILEPTLRGRLQGDYKTGKRISMKKVIPFIASNYRKDKIWLRRTKASKREYQILVGFDNSRSMSECGVGPIALQALAIICQAMMRLEVGELGVCSYGGEHPRVLLPLGKDFSSHSLVGALQKLTFMEESAQSHQQGLPDLLQLCINMFERGGMAASSRAGGSVQVHQMILIVTDGRFNKAAVRKWVHVALSKRHLPVLIIVDTPRKTPTPSPDQQQAASSSSSVFDLKTVTYEGSTPKVTHYLEDFPFPYYAVVQDVTTLPAVLTNVIRQWFDLMK